MDRRVLLIVAMLAALGVAAGFGGVDHPLAAWVRASGIESAPVFVWTLGALDTVSGERFWIWGIGCVALLIGAIVLFRRRDSRLGRALVVAALIQFATLVTMIAGKNHFGRLRPFVVFTQPNGAPLWYAGGDSFPSGHASFYFGILLPLAAACPIRWLRAVLLAIPLFAIVARIDMAKHFLSDVSTGTLIAALYALLAAWIVRRWLPAPQPPASATSQHATAVR